MSPRGLPAPPDDLPELPSAKLGTKSLWRIHAADVAPWFFDVGPDGRFNLAESGTCYLAEEPLGAFVEKFGPYCDRAGRFRSRWSTRNGSPGCARPKQTSLT